MRSVAHASLERHAPQAVADVLLHRHVRKQRVRLEHHVDRPLVRRHFGHVHIVDQDAAGARARESRQHAQQRRLAASRGAHQGEHLALVDAQIDAVDRGEGAEGLVDAFDDDLRLGVGIEPGPIGRRFLLRRQHARLKLRRRRRAAPLRRKERPLHDLRSRHSTLPHEFSIQIDVRPEVEPIWKYGASTIASAMLRLQVGDHMAELTLPISRLPFSAAYSSALCAGLLPAMSRPTKLPAWPSELLGEQRAAAREVSLLEVDQPAEPELQRRAVAAGANGLFGGHEIDVRTQEARPRCAPC